MTPNARKFVCAMARGTLVWEARTGLPAATARLISILAVAQGCIESEGEPPQPDGSGGWGSSVLYLEASNPFGIKFHVAAWGSITAPTTEYIGGVKRPVMGQFQRYPDLSYAIEDHAVVLLEHQAVQNALAGGGGLEAVAEALGPKTSENDTAHMEYSSAPGYKVLVMEIVTDLKLQEPGQLEAYAAQAA